MSRRVEFYRHCLGEAEAASVRETLSTIFLTLGPRVGEFEKQLASYLQVPDVVGVGSCSMGLVLALRAFDVGHGDEVITTPMTFVATPNAALQVGATPVFADVHADTGLINVDLVRKAITPRTKAVIAVDLYGQHPDYVALRKLCDEYGLALIEDAAHSVEAQRDGYRTGNLADAATFSFYATKNLTSGDGGAIAVRDPAIAQRLRSLRNHGITKDAATRYGQRYSHWDMKELGYKTPLTDIQAALLLPQLPHVDERRNLRQKLVELYESLLADETRVQLIPRVGHSSHHLFAALVPADLRDRVLGGLGDRAVGCAVNYRSVHVLDYYRTRFGFSPSDFPVAYEFGERTVSLPLWPYMPEEDVHQAVRMLKESLDEAEGAS